MNVDLQAILLKAPSPLSEALKVIDANAQGICFIVDDKGKIIGTLTDGDIRRSLLKGNSLDTDVRKVMNTTFKVALITEPAENINAMLNEKVRHIPLVDSEGVVIDYASRTKMRHIPVMQPSLSGNELAYVTDCIKTGWISSQGSYVKQFEKMFAEYCGMPYALATSNGTTALHLALVSVGIGPGDEVIVPDFTFAASINSILYTGATPVIVDIDKDTWTIDIKSVRKAITPKTKAIMPVHIYGNPCDMDSIIEVAEKYKLLIVEDCAESLGSFYKGKATGTFGAVSAFSFFGNKTITTGEGGMLLYRDKETYERASVLRDHGMSKQKKYWHDHVGFNYRMTNVQAAIGVAQMERIHQIVDRKIELAKKYDSSLQSFEGLQLQKEMTESKSTYWLYTLLVLPKSSLSREELAERLTKNGIETRPAFYPLHAMPLYSSYKGENDLSNSTHVSKYGLSLPSYIDLSEVEIKEIVRAIRNAYEMKVLQS